MLLTSLASMLYCDTFFTLQLEKSPTLGSIESSDFEKRSFAYKSLEFNLKDKFVLDLFPSVVEVSQVLTALPKAAHLMKLALNQFWPLALLVLNRRWSKLWRRELPLQQMLRVVLPCQRWLQKLPVPLPQVSSPCLQHSSSPLDSQHLHLVSNMFSDPSPTTSDGGLKPKQEGSYFINSIPILLLQSQVRVKQVSE